MRLTATLFLCLSAALLAAPAAARAETAVCSSPAQSCGADIPAHCLSTLGVGSIAASSPSASPTSDGSECAGVIAAYRACLSDFVERCGRSVQPEAVAAPQKREKVDWPRRFDGRVGWIAVSNPTLYALEITLWHPDSGTVFGSWEIEGQSEVYLLHNGEKFAIGNDWGVQFGDAPARSVGEATAWTQGLWTASPERFFQ